jgi:hypothetical protein
MPDAPPKLAYSLTEARNAIGVSRSTLYRMISSGEIETFPMLDKQFIRGDVLRSFIDSKSGRTPPTVSPPATSARP